MENTTHFIDARAPRAAPPSATPEDKLFEGVYFLAAGVAALAGFAIAVRSLRKKPRGRRRR